MRRGIFVFLTIVAAVCLPAHASIAPRAKVVAIFHNKAIVLVDGKRHVLTVGAAASDGVRLINTDTKREQATVELDGVRYEMGLLAMTQSVAWSKDSTVVLYAEQNGHYRTHGKANLKDVDFLLDTGATNVVFNVASAKSLGIDYQKNGKPGQAQTANGKVRTYDFVLDTVTVGDITRYNVAASVIENDGPPLALLGMSFLNSVDIKREGNKLELIERH